MLASLKRPQMKKKNALVILTVNERLFLIGMLDAEMRIKGWQLHAFSP